MSSDWSESSPLESIIAMAEANRPEATRAEIPRVSGKTALHRERAARPAGKARMRR